MSKKTSRRNVVVFGVLLGSLGVTSVMLLALSGKPLADSRSVAFAAESSTDLGAVFSSTRVEFEPHRWTTIYIHQSATPAGNAAALADPKLGFGDHFLIGNGEGHGDGDIEMGSRWLKQSHAIIDGHKTQDHCITICLVGDFDKNSPTQNQLRALRRLVQALRDRCNIRSEDVHLNQRDQGVLGVGRHFPAGQFRQDLPR